MQAWLGEQAPGTLTISDWVVTEFASALAMKLRMGLLEVHARAEVLATFARIKHASLEQLTISRADFRLAEQFVHQHATGLRASDALHLAVAANHGDRLYTLDKVLADAAATLGVSAHLL